MGSRHRKQMRSDIPVWLEKLFAIAMLDTNVVSRLVAAIRTILDLLLVNGSRFGLYITKSILASLNLIIFIKLR